MSPKWPLVCIFLCRCQFEASVRQNWDGIDSYLAPFTCTNSIMVARGLVLADETGLVDPWWRRWRRWAGYDLLWACALGLHSYKRTETAFSLTQCTIISSRGLLGSFEKTALCSSNSLQWPSTFKRSLRSPGRLSERALAHPDEQRRSSLSGERLHSWSEQTDRLVPRSPYTFAFAFLPVSAATDWDECQP